MLINCSKIRRSLVGLLSGALHKIIIWTLILYFVVTVVLALWYFMEIAFFQYYYHAFSDIKFEYVLSFWKKIIVW